MGPLQVVTNPQKDTEIVIHGGEFYNGDKVRAACWASSTPFLLSNSLLHELHFAEQRRGSLSSGGAARAGKKLKPVTLNATSMALAALPPLRSSRDLF